MPKKFIIVLAIALLITPVLFWRAFIFKPAPEESVVPVALAARDEEEIGLPIRLLIPSIGVNALIESVTVAKDGSMGVPVEPMNTAWYSPGPRPGEAGSAVIDGHVDWLQGAEGVFKDLHKVQVGEEIAVEDEFGTSFVFVVKEMKRLDARADATEVFLSADGVSRLNLITCIGAWDKDAEQYAERLVVFAEKVIKE